MKVCDVMSVIFGLCIYNSLMIKIKGVGFFFLMFVSVTSIFCFLFS